jgi:nitrite reductase/ring-hydroxylating ferredoxin subunit
MTTETTAASRFFVTRNWYVGAMSAELRDKPLGRLICGQRIVFFRDPDGRPQAVSAVCPHRGADLGRGRVIGDSVECPFHGLRFNGGGACTRIPSQDAEAPIPRALRVPSYAVVEQGGMVWIWPEPNDTPTRAPEVPEVLGLKAPWRVRLLPEGRLSAGSYLNTMENALDDAHLAFVHKATVPGASERVAPFRITVDEDRRGYGGVATMAEIIAETPAVADVATGSGGLLDFIGRFAFESLKPVEKAYHYRMSGFVLITTTDASGPRDYTFAFFTPGDAERSWLFGGIAQFRRRTAARALYARLDGRGREDPRRAGPRGARSRRIAQPVRDPRRSSKFPVPPPLRRCARRRGQAGALGARRRRRRGSDRVRCRDRCRDRRRRRGGHRGGGPMTSSENPSGWRR